MEEYMFDELIEAVLPDVNQYIFENRINVDGYNIYKILHVTHNEVLMCRVLADLLNPNGMHNEGCTYLQAFLKQVLDMEVSVDALRNAHVYKEYPILHNRRIDIVIWYQNTFIPIEIKINAEDQESQCYDYYQYAKSKTEDAFIVYLTKDGYNPSDYSIYGGIDGKDSVPENKIRCISFSNDMVRWLQNMIAIASENMKPMIRQYIDAIKDFTENREEELRMAIAKKIGFNSDTLRASIEISKAVDEAKAEQIFLLFEEFKRQMQSILDNYGLVEEERSHWFHYRDQANTDFYAHAESTYPGLNYILKNAEMGDGLSLWFRIEVEDRLFGCFCLFNYNLKTDFGMGNQQDAISEEIWNTAKKYVELPEKHTTNSWILDWKYIPTGSSSKIDDIDTVPNFKVMNEAAIMLADKNRREEFVRRSIDVIEKIFLSKIKN